MIQISSVLYALGIAGGSAGLYATLSDISAIVASGPLVVFLSIAILWAGLVSESIEEQPE